MTNVIVLHVHTPGTPLYTPSRWYTPGKFWYTLGCTIHPVDKHCFKAFAHERVLKDDYNECIWQQTTWHLRVTAQCMAYFSFGKKALQICSSLCKFSDAFNFNIPNGKLFHNGVWFVTTSVCAANRGSGVLKCPVAIFRTGMACKFPATLLRFVFWSDRFQW